MTAHACRYAGHSAFVRGLPVVRAVYVVYLQRHGLCLAAVTTFWPASDTCRLIFLPLFLCSPATSALCSTSMASLISTKWVPPAGD